MCVIYSFVFIDSISFFGYNIETAMKSGGDRYHFGLSTYNVAPTFMNKEVTGEAFVQRLAAFKQDSEWDQRRKEYGKMWYV